MKRALWSVLCLLGVTVLMIAGAIVMFLTLAFEVERPLTHADQRAVQEIKHWVAQQIRAGTWEPARPGAEVQHLVDQYIPHDSEMGANVLFDDFPPSVIVRYGLPPAGGFVLRKWIDEDRMGVLASWAPQPAWYGAGSWVVYPLDMRTSGTIWLYASALLLLALGLFLLLSVHAALTLNIETEGGTGSAITDLQALTRWISALAFIMISITGNTRELHDDLGFSITGLSGYILLPLIPSAAMALAWLLLIAHTRLLRPSLWACGAATVGAVLAVAGVQLLSLAAHGVLLLTAGDAISWIPERIVLLKATLLTPAFIFGALVGVWAGCTRMKREQWQLYLADRWPRRTVIAGAIMFALLVALSCALLVCLRPGMHW